MTDSANILFIDDEPKAGDLFKRLIRGTNYQAEVFDDPQLALKCFTDQGADLIITLHDRAEESIPAFILTCHGVAGSCIGVMEGNVTAFTTALRRSQCAVATGTSRPTGDPPGSEVNGVSQVLA